MLRLAIPLLYMFGPKLLPPIIKFLRLIWRLTFDKRVSIFLRMLVPLAIVYVVSPYDLLKDWIPIVGRFDDLLILALATLLLTKLTPKHIVDELSGASLNRDRPEDKDPSNVVDGSSRIVDDG